MSRYLLLLTALLIGCSGSTGGPNRAPVAVAGPDRTVAVGGYALLDGTSSFDPDGDRLSYTWEVLAAPTGADAGAVLQAESQEGLVRFTPTHPGTWLAALQVSDGSLMSQRDPVFLRIGNAPCTTDTDCKNDGLYCNGTYRCIDGSCVHQPVVCDDGDACTRDMCNEEQDQCTTTPMPDGTACDDGLYCTDNDVCTAGACSGADRDCSFAQGDCTDAYCNEDLDQCEGVPKADGEPCEDGLYCTVDDQCSGGGCQSGSQRDCSASGGSCVDGVCNEDTDQCEGNPLPDGTACDDADLCTTGDECQGGVCLGIQLDCSHLSGPCSSGSCNPSTGQCEAQAINEGQDCDDGQYCTEGDTCLQGSCTGSQRDCSHLTAQCVNGVCDEAADECQAQPVGNGQPCDDGDPCTFPDECQDGACQSGPPCPLGCDTSGIPTRCYEINPSNVGHDYLCPANASDLIFSSDTTVNINTDNGTINGSLVVTAQWVPQGSDARDILVLSFTNITIPQTTTVNVSGSHPLALIACADVEINGLINVSASQQQGGPGGYDGGDGNANDTWAEGGDGYGGGGGGAGFRETSQPYCHTPGGGGGFGRTGGDGGDSDASGYTPRQGGDGGAENCTVELIPLVGGSGGGGGAGRVNGAFGGGGGGAIQITAGGSVRIGSTGGIRASGAGGWISQNQYFGGGGGGGAGGGILIEGASVEIQGRLTANGGGGGGGRTDYPGWGLYCPSGTPTVGEDGPHENRRANGGADCTSSGSYPAGDGGRGGAQSDGSTLGENGGNGYIGGGGGGGAGRIRLNSFENSNTDTTGSTISPNCSGANQRCTTGAVSLW